MKGVETTSPQSGSLVLPLASADAAGRDVRVSADLPTSGSGLSGALLQELWIVAEGEVSGLLPGEFAVALEAVGFRLNFGLPPGTPADAGHRESFLRGLRLGDLALATGCALGRQAAWERFLDLYRDPLTRAAIAITGSATMGHELADSLYAELYGLREADGARRSPLASYSGRGSLLGWLRTTLAQRHIDHHRRTHRETPLDDLDAPTAAAEPAPNPASVARLGRAVTIVLKRLTSEDRFLLAAYFLDRLTLLQIARTLGVHEATISRRLKRLAAELRRRLIETLESGGLTRCAAEEALGTDPRDIEINLRAVLQTSQTPAFSYQGPGVVRPAAAGVEAGANGVSGTR